jgi:hypothetical protein
VLLSTCYDVVRALFEKLSMTAVRPHSWRPAANK